MGKLLTAVTTASALLPAAKTLAEATSFDVRKTNGCGYCLAWMEHLEENGFAPVKGRTCSMTRSSTAA